MNQNIIYVQNLSINIMPYFAILKLIGIDKIL